MGCVFYFFFQAEDGIRDWSVTGVQTCALPISVGTRSRMIFALVEPCWAATRRLAMDSMPLMGLAFLTRNWAPVTKNEIGRASCRERVEMREVCGARSQRAEWKNHKVTLLKRIR